MAWSIVGVGSVVEVTATSHALTEPAGCAAGDLLVACIVSRIASTTSITLPTGGAWTLVNEQKANNTLTTSSALPSAMMAYAVRGASAPNLTFTHPAAPTVAIGRIVAYRGGATTSVLDANTAATTATNITAVSVAGLTTTQANDLIVALAAGGQEANWSSFNATTPSGASGATDTATAPSAAWCERADSITTTGADTSLGIFDALKTAAGATGNLTVTASVAAGHSIVAGAFKILPAAVNVSVSVTGQAITAAVGDVTIDARQTASVSIAGQAVAVSVGTVSVIAIAPITVRSYAIGGFSGAGYYVETSDRDFAVWPAYVSETIEEAAPAGDVAVPVTGQTVAVSVGTVSVVGKANVPSLGQAVATAVGTVTVDAKQAIVVPVLGQSVSASVGTVTVSTTAMAGVGVWNGSAWVDKPVKVWSGLAWVQKPVKHWNGSAWV